MGSLFSDHCLAKGELCESPEMGRQTIPKELRDRFGLHHDVEIVILATDQGLLIQKKDEGQSQVEGAGTTVGEKDSPVDRVAGILDKDALGDGVSVDQYIDEIRGR